jgi:hypothetical protein
MIYHFASHCTLATYGIAQLCTTKNAPIDFVKQVQKNFPYTRIRTLFARFKFRPIDRENEVEHMSSTNIPPPPPTTGQQNNSDIRLKIISLRVTENELQNIIKPVMHDCYQLGIIDHDTLTSFLRFCVQFWISHYHMKKQQFEMSQQEIEEEKKKLDAIIAEKEAWHKWDNSTPQVMKKAVKQLEQMGDEFERDSKRELQQRAAKPKQQQQQEQQSSEESPLANMSLEDMMA